MHRFFAQGNAVDFSFETTLGVAGVVVVVVVVAVVRARFEDFSFPSSSSCCCGCFGSVGRRRDEMDVGAVNVNGGGVTKSVLLALAAVIRGAN